MVVADGFVGKAALLQTGEIELAIPHRDILGLTAPEVIRLQVGDGIAVAAAGTLPQVGAQQHVAFHQLAHGGAAPGGKAAQQPLAGDLVLLLTEGLQCGGIAGAALAALTPAELVAAIGALAFSGAQHAAAGVLAFSVFVLLAYTLTPFSATKFAGIPHSTLLGHIFGRVFALTPPDGVIFSAIYVN